MGTCSLIVYIFFLVHYCFCFNYILKVLDTCDNLCASIVNY